MASCSKFQRLDGNKHLSKSQAFADDCLKVFRLLTGADERDRMHPHYKGRVAQWQSSGLLSHWLKVRVLPRSQGSPSYGGLFCLNPLVSFIVWFLPGCFIPFKVDFVQYSSILKVEI